MRISSIAAAAVLAIGCAGVQPQDHLGFHFHGDLGAAGSYTGAREDGMTAELSGGGATFSLAAGGAIVPNLVLGAEVWGVAVNEPEAQDWDGTRYTIEDATFATYGVGPRLTWYLMPANVYFSATPSFTRLSLSDDYSDYSEESRWGIGFRGAVGKEWLVSPRWGLGVAGVVHLSGNKWPGGGPTWRTWGGGLVFSASFN